VNTAIVVNHEDAPVPLIVGAVHTLLSFVISKFKEAWGLANALYELTIGSRLVLLFELESDRDANSRCHFSSNIWQTRRSAMRPW
jgi:hypothetical protein